MHIDIKATNTELTPPLKEYIEGKIGSLDKFLKRWQLEGQIKCRVEVGRTTHHHHKGNVFRAEVNIDLPGTVLRVEEIDTDIRIAVDRAKDRLKAEITRFKELATEGRRG